MRRALTPLVALAVLAAPRAAEACAVCFGGDPGSKTVKAITLGVLVLLGTVFSVITALVAAVWRIEQRRTLAEAASVTPSPRGAA